MVIRNGIDVSRHQGSIDWVAVKEADIEFAMLRIGYGTTGCTVDSRFLRNYHGAGDAGIYRGGYFYSYFHSVREARKSADTLCSLIEDMEFEYPIALDFEERSQLNLPLAQQVELISAFLQILEESGFYAMLYMSASSMQRLIKAHPQEMSRWDKWVAHWGLRNDKDTVLYSDVGGIWQHNNAGVIDGLSTVVDLNLSYKDYPDIMINNRLNNMRRKDDGEKGFITIS